MVFSFFFFTFSWVSPRLLWSKHASGNSTKFHCILKKLKERKCFCSNWGFQHEILIHKHESENWMTKLKSNSKRTAYPYAVWVEAPSIKLWAENIHMLPSHLTLLNGMQWKSIKHVNQRSVFLTKSWKGKSWIWLECILDLRWKNT